MARTPRSTREPWRQAVRRCSSVLLVIAGAGLLGSCGGGGGDDVQRGTPGASGTSGTGSVGTGTGAAMLAWDAVVTPNLAGYHIYVGTSTGMYAQPFGSGLNAGNVLTYSVTGLNRGTRYYFAATAFDSMGNESGYSNEVFKDIP